LDKWTVDWVATFGGQSQTFRTFVEVAGDVLFTLSEARALKPLDNTTTYPTRRSSTCEPVSSRRSKMHAGSRSSPGTNETVSGLGNITVGYEYGLDRPPQRIKMDALRLCRQWLVNGPVDDRALGVAAPDGAFSFGLATPGRNGSIFGLPDLDAAIQASPYRLGIA
jgi:hypothetical protein